MYLTSSLFTLHSYLLPETEFPMPLSPSAVPLLLDWYRTNRRDLPWRATRDPYPVLVSEIMLQQTRAETTRSWMPLRVPR